MPIAARPFLDYPLENPFPGIPALERKLGRPIISRLSGNEAVPLYPEKWLRTYREEFLTKCREYPDPSAFELRQALARLNKVELDELLVDAGADSLIHLVLRTFANTADSVLCCAGTYPTFEYFARGLGLQIREVAYSGRDTGLRADLPALLAAAWDIRPRVLYLANPDNPTGHYLDQASIAAFANALPSETLLLLDEAYVDFASAGPEANQLLNNTIRLRSFSKGYGLAGMRIGYALAPADLLSYAQQARVHYSVSGIAQWLAIQALEDDDHAASLREETLRLRSRFVKEAEAAKLAFIPSATNFICLPMPGPETASRLQWALLELGVSVSKPDAINGQSLIRVTLQSDLFVPQIARLVFVATPLVLP